MPAAPDAVLAAVEIQDGGPSPPASAEQARNKDAAESCTAVPLGDTQLALTGENEAPSAVESSMADDAAVLRVESDQPSAGELEDANREGGQQSIEESLPETRAEAIAPELTADAGAQSDLSEPTREPDVDVVAPTRQRPSKPAQHRDRRGQRRAPQAQPAAASTARTAAVAAALRTPAEARLRLMFHPVRRTVNLSVVLARPAGYPDRITLLLGAGTRWGRTAKTATTMLISNGCPACSQEKSG